MTCTRNNDDRGKKLVEISDEAASAPDPGNAIYHGKVQDPRNVRKASSSGANQAALYASNASCSGENGAAPDAGNLRASAENGPFVDAGIASSVGENEAASDTCSGENEAAQHKDIASSSGEHRLLDYPRRVDNNRTSTGSNSEVWFDAPDATLPDYSCSDESRRPLVNDPASTLIRDEPGSSFVVQLKSKIQRLIAAEGDREALQQQREVSEGVVRADADVKLQIVIEEKNKEIARLRDKLKYYEIVNHEMSQRNQEAFENARQQRRRQQRRNSMIILGLSAAIYVGISAAILYQYAPWEFVRRRRISPALSNGVETPRSLEKVVKSREPTH